MITSNKLLKSSKRRGFTLVEVIFSLGLSVFALASLVPTFTFFSKSVASVGNYTLISEDSRNGLELISRDIHAATDILNAGVTEMSLVLPDDLGGSTVNYRYDSNTDEVTRTVIPISGSGSSEVIFNDVQTFGFTFYNRLSSDVTRAPSILSEVKSVELQAKLVREVFQTENSDHIISARFLMRNI